MLKMKSEVFFLTILIAVVVSGGPAWKDQSVQRGGGIKLGQGSLKNATSSRGSGIKLGNANRGLRTTSTTSLPEEEHLPTPSPPSYSSGVSQLHLGMVVPYKSFGAREYTKAVTSAKYNVARKMPDLFKKYDLAVHTSMKELTPSPTGKSNYLKLYSFLFVLKLTLTSRKRSAKCYI